MEEEQMSLVRLVKRNILVYSRDRANVVFVNSIIPHKLFQKGSTIYCY